MTSFLNSSLTPSVSSTANDRIHLAMFPDIHGGGQIFQGASASLWTLESLKVEHQ
jgi:hypothetical protein